MPGSLCVFSSNNNKMAQNSIIFPVGPTAGPAQCLKITLCLLSAASSQQRLWNQNRAGKFLGSA